MTFKNADAVRTALKSLSGSVPEARWFTLDGGGHVLSVPVAVLSESEMVGWLKAKPEFDSAAPGSGRIFLLEGTPSTALIDALSKLDEQPVYIAWPAVEPPRDWVGLSPLAKISIGGVEWTLSGWRAKAILSADATFAGVDPSRPDQEGPLEDLDARARWFSRRH